MTDGYAGITYSKKGTGLKAYVTTIGMIYLDIETKRPVRVTGDREKITHPEGYNHWLYPVEDLVTGHTYYMRRQNMSDNSLTEMEALAWASLQ